MPIIEPPNPLEGSAIKKIVLPDGIVHQIKDSRIPGVDNTPTSGSDNVVTSGGVYASLPSALTADDIQDIWDATMVGVTLISFTINGVTYQAETGMTWKEWVDSTYNTGGFSYDGDGTNYGSFVRPQENIELSVREPEGNMSVHATDVIVENLDYYYDISGWGGSND